jgi:hypothetical protein
VVPLLTWVPLDVGVIDGVIVAVAVPVDITEAVADCDAEGDDELPSLRVCRHTGTEEW